jgi:chromosome segregation ATPase
MIEPIMYFGIGFLVAALIGLVVIPLVHGRAVRLTMRRLEAATPLSMAEIQADKDQLRAEFAMSTRRLEMSVEQLKGRTTSQLSELSKKTDAINRLKVELGEKTATIFALEARDKALRDQLRASEEEFVVRTTAVQDAERALSDKQGELAKLMSELDERSVLADSQKVEIIALKTQVEALKERLSDAEKEVKTTEDRVAHERIELKEATAELSAERGKVENLGRRVSELEQQLIAQSTEAEMLGRRAHDLESRLTEQSKTLTESEFERNQLRAQMDNARKTEADLRAAVSEINGKVGSATETLRAEKAQLQAELDRANEERTRLAAEINDMKRDTEQAWSSERVENALLRERINDVAAEVARLASALEGPNSPIDAILAAETARDKGALPPVAVEVEPTGEPAAAGGNLADRIRALQSRASRIQQPDEPASRN